MSRTGNQLARLESEEVARGIRMLLASPLLTAAREPDGFDLVRRRREPITKWFDYYCGWRLHVEPRAGYARLIKTTHRPDPTRPARRTRSGNAPFDRRRYTLLCVVCAELLAGPATTIGLLADRVRQTTTVEGLPAFDPSRRDERSAFVDVLLFLEHHGATEPVDGATQTFLDHPDAKVLYRVDTTLVTRLLAAPTAPSTVDDIAQLTRENRYDDSSTAQRNLWTRHSVLRRLVDDPVVYRDELTEDQRAFLASPSGRKLVHTAVGIAGCTLEERAEGFLLVDADAIATDTRFPDDDSHAKVAALILLDRLAHGDATEDDLVAETDQLLTRFPNWAKAYRSDGGAARLAQDGLALLRAFGLARTENGNVSRLPAAARYAVEEPHD